MRRVMLVLVLFLFPIAFAVTAEVSFNQTVYSMGSYGNITLVDPDYNTDPGSIDPVYVRVNSTSDNVGILVLLKETGTNTGIFVSENPVQFSDYTSQDELKIKVSYGDTVYVFHEDDNNQYTYNTSFIAYTATISSDKISYSYLETVSLEVADYDNPADSIDVYVNSTSDPVGISISLSKNSNGTYNGTFQLYSSSSSAERRIEASEGDKIWITYEDPTDETGNRRNVSLTIYTTMRGIVEFDNQYIYSNPSMNQYYSLEDIANVYVIDYDMNKNRSDIDHFTITVKSKNTGSEIQVEVYETESDSGIFNGTFSFSETENNDYSDILLVSNGDIVNASYFDTTTYQGFAVETSNIAKYYTTLLATIYFNNDIFYPESEIIITVEDPDRNVIPTVVDGIESRYSRIYSDDDPIGFNISMWETSEDTGIFVDSSIKIGNATDPVKHVIEASNNSKIYFTYFDCKNAFCTDNVTQTINATYIYSETAEINVSDDVVVSGNEITITVRDNDSFVYSPYVNISYSQGKFQKPLSKIADGLYQTTYTFSSVVEGEKIMIIYPDPSSGDGSEKEIVKVIRAASDATISASDGSGNAEIYPLDYVVVDVVDDDRNLNEYSIDNITVTFHKGSLNYTATAYETGIDTGTFSVSVQSSNIKSSLSLSDGELFYVTYTDPYNSTKMEQNITSELTYRIAYTASLSANTTWMNNEGDVEIYLIDNDLSGDSVDVNVRTTLDEQNVTLTGSAGYYSSVIHIGGSGLNVGQEDVVTLSYVDPVNGKGDEQTVTYEIIYDSKPPSLTATADREWYSNGDTVVITVSADEEFNVTGADFSMLDSNPGSYDVVDTGTVSTITYTISQQNSRTDGYYNVTITGEDKYGNAASINITIKISKLRISPSEIDFGKLHPGENATVEITITNDDVVKKTINETFEVYMDVNGYYSAVNFTKSIEEIGKAFVYGENRIWYDWLSSNFTGEVDANSDVVVAVNLSVPSYAMPGNYEGKIIYNDSYTFVEIPLQFTVEAPYVLAFRNGSLLQNYSVLRFEWNINTGTKAFNITFSNIGNKNTTISFTADNISDGDSNLAISLPSSFTLGIGEEKNATFSISTTGNASTYRGFVYAHTSSSPFDVLMFKIVAKLVDKLEVEEFFYQTSAYDKVVFNMSIKYVDGTEPSLSEKSFRAVFSNSSTKMDVPVFVVHNGTYYIVATLPEDNTEDFSLELIISDGKGNYYTIYRNYTYVFLGSINTSQYISAKTFPVEVEQNGTAEAKIMVENRAFADIVVNLSTKSKLITNLPRNATLPAFSNTTIQYLVQANDSVGTFIERIVVGDMVYSVKIRIIPNNITKEWLKSRKQELSQKLLSYYDTISEMKGKGYDMRKAEENLESVQEMFNKFSEQVEKKEWYAAYMTLSKLEDSMKELENSILNAKKSKVVLIAVSVLIASIIVGILVYLFGPGGKERRKRLVRWIVVKYRQWVIRRKMKW